MKIYHGSLERVVVPEIRKPNRRLDYGGGFYATTSFQQAERWVQRKMRESKQQKGYVNVYELDLTALDSLKVLSFCRLRKNGWILLCRIELFKDFVTNMI